MKRTLLVGMDRIKEFLRRPGSVQRLLVGFVLAGLTLVFGAFPSLGQPGHGFGSKELESDLYFPPDPRTAAYHRQSLEKARVAQEVLEGRKTFGDAVAAFRQLHAVGPQRGTIMRFYHPGCSEEEALRWNVVAFLRSALRERPDKAAQVEHIEQEMNRASVSDWRS